MQNQKILLASSSPYRKQLLEKLNLDFTCASPNINEQTQENETAPQLALRLAKEKALALAKQYPQHIIIASDQVAILKGQQLGKPGNKQNTIQQLQDSSGQSIEFHTSLCVLNSATQVLKTDIDCSTVHFKSLSKQEINNYVEQEKPYNCAGGFKSEGLGIALFKRIESNDPNSLIGLPLIKLITLLKEFGIDIL
ncbi:MAG: Maf family protein [Methyloprofundus sp.]|nr:Maf family protein [Methyloprofundus sp.]